MKRIALAIENSQGLDGPIATHFGRCVEFIIVEVNDDGKVANAERVENPLTGHHGSACQIPQYVKQFNINTMIAGGMGAKAIALFDSFGIEVVTGASGLAKDVLVGYLGGEIKGVEQCKQHGGGECH